MCHVSGIRCNVFCYCFFVDKVVELVSGGSVINGAYPVYFNKYPYTQIVKARHLIL